MLLTVQATLRRSGVLIAGTAALLLLTSSIAAADEPTTASQSGVSASGAVTFTSSTTFEVRDLTLNDTSCDKNDVYVEVRSNLGEEFERRNSNGCNTTVDLPPVLARDAAGGGLYRYLWFKVCVDSPFRNDCTDGPRVDNPNVS